MKVKGYIWFILSAVNLGYFMLALRFAPIKAVVFILLVNGLIGTIFLVAGLDELINGNK